MSNYENGPKPIVFTNLEEVPAGSVGYFSNVTNEGPDLRTAGSVTKREDGSWINVRGRVNPKPDWVFTSQSGPANTEQYRQQIRAELVTENIGLTHDQTNTVLSALYAKLAETESYLRGYSHHSEQPKPSDECCAYHWGIFKDRTKQREALKERAKKESELIELFLTAKKKCTAERPTS